MEQNQLYIPEKDIYFSKPYIDVEEWRSTPVHHYYVHGGFRGTDIDGRNEARFTFYFPEKEKYEGRFFQYLSPAPEHENESEKLTGEDDKIAFCLTHGAYYVVSNQGGCVIGGNPARLYKTSAQTAEFSRRVARRFYETEARPYGYIFGGSGGSFKTLGCMEATENVWDGAVPYVMANPMAAPNVFAPRMRAMRLLGEAGMEKIAEAMEPGGSKDIYCGLNDEQKMAVKELTEMGFPPKAWFMHGEMGDGSLMVLVPTIYQLFPTYFRDFWEKEGYEGADPTSNEVKSRVQHITTVKSIMYEKANAETDASSVDNSWVNTMLGGELLPTITINEPLPEEAYQYHSRLRVLTGAAAGAEMNIDTIKGCVVRLHPENGGAANTNPLKELKTDDQVMIDNSDAIAIQCFHRHQVPDDTYRVYDQFKDEDGKPLYPQLPLLIAPMIAVSGAGLVLTGNIHGKVIGLCSLMDESACPWHGDWYRQAIGRCGVDEQTHFRLYYHENSTHDDRAGYLYDPQHQVDYLGTLHQALLDVAAWCEKDIEPLATTNYQFVEGQIVVPEHASERGGMQPVVRATVRTEESDSQEVVQVAVGQLVHFSVVIELIPEAGKVTKVAWDYEKTNVWDGDETITVLSEGSYLVETTHSFTKPGVYFPCVKVQSNRYGDINDIFTQCKNLARVKVIVK